MAGDWLRLYRKSLDSRVFSDRWLWHLWSWCLMRASWKAHHRGAVRLLPGQFATGRHEGAAELHVSASKFYRGLHKLAEWGQIVLESNNHFTVVTLCNWTTYQGDEDDERTTGEQPVNNGWTASEQPVDTNRRREELEEGKTRKKCFATPTVEDVAAYCRERGNRVDPAAFVAHYESKGWVVGKAPMKSWKAAVITWEKNEGKFNGQGKAVDLFATADAFLEGGPLR